MKHILGIFLGIIIVFLLFFAFYDRYVQKKNIVMGNFPILGRLRYFFHELRPFFRQYFGDDNAFAPRIVIDWILNVSSGRTGYFAFDKFDTTNQLHNGKHQLIHAPTPYNQDELEEAFPVVGETKKNPFYMKQYLYRSAMSLGSLSFEATSAMAAACADTGAAFNTGEGGLSVHHIPRVKYTPEKKFFTAKKIPLWGKKLLKISKNLSNGVYLNVLDFIGNKIIGKDKRDLYLYDQTHSVFYKIDWNAPIEAFPKPEELDASYGNIIFQIGSGLYGLRKEGNTDVGHPELDWQRFQKITSFCRAIEIKLAQGAKQTGGILKKHKNTPAIAEIRGIKAGMDLVSPNRFPLFPKTGNHTADVDDFFKFLKKASNKAGGKPIGVKVVISNRNNVEGLIQKMAENEKNVIDFITVDGGDGGTGAAPIALGVLFGKRIYEALEIVIKTLKKHNVRQQVKVFASGKLYAPHMSAKAFALGADAIGNARSIMISGGCIRAGVCSGEHGTCPIGMATMNKTKRKAYARAWEQKVINMQNYIKAHHKGLMQVAGVAGEKNPMGLNLSHIPT